MQKVGIITIVKVANYGAELQAFATQHIINLLGYDSEIIDYVYYKNPSFHDTERSQPLIPLSLKQRFFYWLKYRCINYLAETVLSRFLSAYRSRSQRFESFHKRNTRFSRAYYSMDELYSNCPKYDIYVAGSDQIWNPNASSSIEPYFLTFVEKNKAVKKISYASSFGISSIPATLQEKYRDWLSDFDTISVREQGACGMVEQLIGKPATWVLDPTLLLTKDQWLSVAQPYPKLPNKYVLIYQLSDNPIIERLAKKIGQEQRVPVLRITKRAFGLKRMQNITDIRDAGPAEFVYLIANASFLVTDSFHGTAFATNLGTPFYSVVSAKKQNNSRIESLLNLLGLQERMVTDTINLDRMIVTVPGEMHNSQQRLTEERIKSIDYIKTSLC